MSPEALLGRKLPAVEVLLKATVERALAAGEEPTLHELERATKEVLPQVG